MKRLSSINLSRISFRSFLFSCSMFFACAHTHAASFSLSKILTMGMLFVASQTQGNNHPEVSLGLTDSNNSLQIHSYDNEVMNNSNLTNSYPAFTGCNNDTFSPSTLRLIDSEGNSVQCSFKATDYDDADIICTYGNLKKQNSSLAMCNKNNKCVMLPMSYEKNEPDKFDLVQWLGLGFITIGVPIFVILRIIFPDPREEREKKQREKITLLEAELSVYKQQTATLPSNHGEK